MGALIIAEHNNQHLLSATIATIDAASHLTKNITVLVIGSNCQSVVKEASCAPNVTKILDLDHINYTNLLAENITSVIIEIISKNPTHNYEYIMVGSTTFGKNILPRIAACLDVEQISEVTKIISKDTFERFIYAGNAIQTVRLLCNIKCLTIRTTNFNDEFIKNFTTASIEQLDPQKFIWDQRIRFAKNQIKNKQSSHPELTTAKIVVAGGSSLKSKENFLLIEQLAGKLNAAVGASKSAIDAGFAPNSWQIGQTGKIIAPKLYIAVGISGAVQHVAGIKESKIIVAINIDENAPIFQVAHYAMVGDLFKIIPELIKEIDLHPPGAFGTTLLRSEGG